MIKSSALQRGLRCVLMCCLIIGLTFTNAFSYWADIDGYASESVTNTTTIPAGYSGNGYVTDISIPISTGNSDGIEGYTFSNEITDYNVTLADTRTGGFTLSIPKNLANELYYSVYIDGAVKKDKVQIKAEKTENIPSMTFFSTTATAFPVGESKTFSIKVGKLDKDKEDFETADVYNYEIRRSLNIGNNNFKVFDADENALNLSPAVNSLNNNPYDRIFSTTYGGESISLEIKPKTTGASVYVGNSEYTNRSIIKLEDYTAEGNDIAEIPITLKYKGVETTYTLNVSSQDYSPIIQRQPQSATVDKGSNAPLEIEASLLDGAKKGVLSYQWYEVVGSTMKTLTGATSASYQPPTNYAGTTYYQCVVTNTVENVSYSINSDVVSYTVNLTYLTAPEFVVQPRQSENSNGGSTFFIENGTPEIEAGPLGGFLSEGGFDYVEGAEYQLKLYRNSVASTEGGEEIDCVVSCSSTFGKALMYTFQVPSQNITGTWYYYVTVTVSKDGYEDATSVSEILPLTFKKATDVVKELEGEGTESSPFLLRDVDDLLYVKSLVEGTNGDAYTFAGQVLAFDNDIELPADWEPIGNLKAGTTDVDEGRNIQPFSGIIDGKGYTLTVADHGKSLLNYVRKATVKNLNIYGTHIDGYGLVEKYSVDYGEEGNYVEDPIKFRAIDIENVTIKSGTNILKSGFIGGFASGVNAINIRNCIVEEGVVIGYNKDQNNIGSLAGEFNGTIENCVSKATVYGINTVGGLIGNKGQSMGPCNIINSSFQGEVIATGNRVGGIAGSGYISGSAPGTPMVQIHNCYVTANITGMDKVGGIIGSEEGHYNNVDEGDSYGIKGTLSVTDTFYYGELSATGLNIGGTIGYLHDFTKKTGEATNYFLEGCGASNGIGGVIEGEVEGMELYSISATSTEFSDGTILTKLNNSDSSYKNWSESTLYPVLGTEPIITSLSLSGDYKTTYYLGDELELENLIITANKSDGSKIQLTAQDVEITGYDKSTRGVQTVTVKYGAVTAEINVTVLLPEQPGQSNEITVYFTLLGDEVHDSSAEGETVHTLSGGNLTTWISRVGVRVDKNATVMDLLKKMLDEKEWTYANPTGNYVESITRENDTLGEFTNGPNSGWMYTFNGTHPTLGVNEQYLNNGDRVVFHYTDDWTKEEDTDKWEIPSSGVVTPEKETTEVTTSGSASTESGAVTTTPTEVKVSGTTATATITDANVTETIKQATENKSSEIVVQVSESDTKGAETVKVQLNTATVKSIVNDTDAALTVKTENGTVTLDAKTLETVAAEAKGSTITLEVIETKAPTAAQKEALGEGAHMITLVIKSGDKVISEFKEGKATVKVEIPAALKDKKVTAVHITDDGVMEHLGGKTVTENSKTYHQFTTPHFSDFALVDAEALGLTDELTADEVKALLADLTPVVRSAKTAKKNVKVTLKLDEADQAIIDQIEDAGYTVKYNFYRSTKKSSKYSSMLMKEGTTYTNTAGKKGKMYYYKARVQVYDADGKLIARTELKQCKYANRKWTK